VILILNLPELGNSNGKCPLNFPSPGKGVCWYLVMGITGPILQVRAGKKHLAERDKCAENMDRISSRSQ
jgi:hypothetical protein